MISKCGEVRVWHWAHQGRRTCDPWWENETEWHRNWKDRFPKEWQEVVQQDRNGERHIADVKTDRGRVLEFQRSHLNPEERRSREAFYENLIWIVDGTRRSRDQSQFLKALQEGVVVDERARICRVFPDECRLLVEWSESAAPVLFDFAGARASGDSALWLLVPGVIGSLAYVLPISSAEIVSRHQATAQPDEDFGLIVKDLSRRISLFIQNQTRSRSFASPRVAIPRVRRTPRF
jgi:hypothetical protein